MVEKFDNRIDEESILSRILIYDLPEDEEAYERDYVPNSFEKLTVEECKYVMNHPEMLKKARHIVMP